VITLLREMKYVYKFYIKYVSMIKIIYVCGTIDVPDIIKDIEGILY